MEAIDKVIVIPEADRGTSVSPQEALFIHTLLTRTKCAKTLEIGFAYGYSAAHIMDATKAAHIAIDPFQEEYQFLGLKNIEALGFADRLTHVPEPSQFALPRIISEGTTVQFVFIDGGHKFDDIFVDWFFADRMLEAGGFLLFHDAWMRSTQLVAEFIRTNRTNYTLFPTPLDNLVLFRKDDGRDERRWYHFEEFYTDRSIEAHDRVKRRLEPSVSP